MNIWEQYPEIKDKLAKVDEIINTSIKSRNKLLREINEGLLKSGGKRLRPALTILSAGFGEYEDAKLLRVAGAIEVLHTATLVHDDIIDRAKLRRGRITVNDKFGAEMAVYTGDYLFTKAILMLADSMSSDKMEIVARAIKNICEGEVDQYESKYKSDISILSYLKRINRKTAILFAASCGLGGFCSDCDDKTTKQLIKVGGFYGM
ncbi:MAG: polyprenyl synthetase family protein, partial [Vallitaleaceae bacterium]|nr:polyprenyl synthetase family protein [Vallitaleaceae bacterium]